MTEKSVKLKEFYNSFSDCKKCPLCKTRTNLVTSRGNPDARLMFIGEAPGKNEDEIGKPFVGAAGQLLDKFLLYAGFEEEDYYITNIIKCRPPYNRDPEPSEEEMCMPYLIEQVKIINPEIIVCLGRIAAQRIISPDFRITKDRGKWFEANNTKIMATYHPAALLRDPPKKMEFLKDIKEIYNQLSK